MSSNSDKNDLMFPAELIGLAKQNDDTTVVMFNGKEFHTNVPYEVALSSLFREDVSQTKRGM